MALSLTAFAPAYAPVAPIRTVSRAAAPVMVRSRRRAPKIAHPRPPWHPQRDFPYLRPHLH